MLNFFIMKHCDGTRNTRAVYLFIPASETAVCLLYLRFSSFFTNRRLILFGSLCVHHKTNTQTESQLEVVLIPFLRITWGWVTGCGFWEIPLKTLWLMTHVEFFLCCLFPFLVSGSRYNAPCDCNTDARGGKSKKSAENFSRAFGDPRPKLQNPTVIIRGRQSIYIIFPKPLFSDSLMFPHESNLSLTQ